MTSRSREEKSITYEAFIGVLSILSMVNLVLFYATSRDAVASVVLIMNVVISLIFFADFVLRLVTAGDDRRQYFFRRFGWADLVSSVPIPQVKVLRIPSMYRAYRRAQVDGAKHIVRTFWHDRAESALLAVFLVVLIQLEFGSMAMVWAEEGADDANITSGSDAIWWSYVTFTTVGYGDQFPVTTAGRIIGVFVLTGGVALFGVLTGYLANLFLAPRKAQEAVITEPNDARSMLNAALRLLEDQEKTNVGLRTRLEEIEQLL